jgi:hypothetical protein
LAWPQATSGFGPHHLVLPEIGGFFPELNVDEFTDTEPNVGLNSEAVCRGIQRQGWNQGPFSLGVRNECDWHYDFVSL